MQLFSTKELGTCSVPFSLAFVPDGRRLALNSPSFGMAVLEPPAKHPIANHPTKLLRLGIGFTADGRVAFTDGNLVTLYDPDEKKVVGHLPVKGNCSCVTISSDGRSLWTAVREDKVTVTIQRWDTATGKLTATFGRYRGGIGALAVSEAGDLVAGFAADQVRVWRLVGNKLPTRVTFIGRVQRYRSLHGAAVSADGTLVAATEFLIHGGRCPVPVWDTQTGKVLFQLEAPTELAGGVAFHPSRPLLAAVGKQGSVIFWDATNGNELAQFTWPVDSLYAVAFSANGRQCAAAADGAVVVWDVT